MRFSVYQVSRKGGRAKNEDRMGYCYTRSAGLFSLADGMGGHPEGEVASQLALQTLAAHFQRDAKPVLKDPLAFLQQAVFTGHQQLLRYATDRGLLDTPRTTVVACVLQGQSAFWAHCGDSRLYLVRDGKLLLRTRDHSYTELHDAMHSSGQVAPSALAYNRNVLFTCLGSPGKPVVDNGGPVQLMPGDRLLLCSDGLWSALSDEVIVQMLSQRPIAQAVPELAERALREAGARSDNVTVLAVEFEGSEASEPSRATSSPGAGDEVFASTIQASLFAEDELPQELDDAEIERSIREINEAIQRSAKKKT